MNPAEKSDQLQQLAEIRLLMENSTRFLSLSGLSGIFAGIFALLGAAAAYLYMDIGIFASEYYSLAFSSGNLNPGFILFFTVDGLAVLFLALFTGAYFTIRNGKRKGHILWNRATRLMAVNLLIPLVTGGIFILMLVYHHLIFLVAPATLIFYGLSLINGSKYTLHEVRYLGVCEIVLGLIGCFLPGYGLLLWTLGFGLLHIVYGIVMYRKYERPGI